MMIITYLIGNGFDINLGLNTRYSDFIERYKVTNDQDNKSILKLKDSINKYCEQEGKQDPNTINWSDMEVGFGLFTKEFVGVQDGDFKLADCHQNLCEALSNYLSTEERRVPVEAICQQDDVLENTWKSMLDISKGLRPNDRRRIEKKTADVSGGIDIRIICFNYTRILDSIAETINEKRLLGTRVFRNANYNNTLESVIHVHGTVEHGMVFGVNDEGQLDNNVFRDEEPELKRVMIKPLFNEDMGEAVDDTVKTRLAASSVIYIYGMSIGETDRRWWEEIVRLMSINTDTILIVHGIEVPAITLNAREYTRYQRQFCRRFIGFCNDLSEDSKKNIENRIFVTNGNVFECLSGIVSES